MAKTTKKPVRQATTKVRSESVAEPQLFPAQPHQVVAINRTDLGILVLDKSRRRGYTDQSSLVLPPGIPILVDAYLLPGIKSNIDSGAVEIPEDQRGVPGRWIDAAFSQDVAEARDGKRPGPNHEERVTHWQDTLVDGSLSRALVEVLEAAGLSDDLKNPEVAEIVRDLVRQYDRSFLEPKGSPLRATKRPWINRAAELIAIHRARQAGLVDVPSATAPEGGGEQ